MRSLRQGPAPRERATASTGHGPHTSRVRLASSYPTLPGWPSSPGRRAPRRGSSARSDQVSGQPTRQSPARDRTLCPDIIVRGGPLASTPTDTRPQRRRHRPRRHRCAVRNAAPVSSRGRRVLAEGCGRSTRGPPARGPTGAFAVLTRPCLSWSCTASFAWKTRMPQVPPLFLMLYTGLWQTRVSTSNELAS